jgi:hypothetical protein
MREFRAKESCLTSRECHASTWTALRNQLANDHSRRSQTHVAVAFRDDSPYRADQRRPRARRHNSSLACADPRRSDEFRGTIASGARIEESDD